MATQNTAIDYAKNKIDQFVMNSDYMNAYDLAEEAERIRSDEISFARDEGREEGRNEERREIVQNMIKKNYDMALIVDATGLSEDVIKSYSI